MVCGRSAYGACGKTEVLQNLLIAKAKSNYAFKPIAEQALRSIKPAVPQRLNAALALRSGIRVVVKGCGVNERCAERTKDRNGNVYCCSFLKNLVINAGDRGFAVLLCRWAGELRFVMQMRALAHQDEAKLREESKPCQSPVTHATLSAATFIKYCPACGTSLGELVVGNSSEFEKLATEHLPFMNRLSDLG